MATSPARPEPMGTDAERAFLQERLGLLAGAIALLTGSFLIFGGAIASVVIPHFTLDDPMIVWGFVSHLAAVLLSIALWRLLKRGRWSQTALDLTDYLLPLGALTGAGIAMSVRAPLEQGRGDLMMMLAVMGMLTMRAVVVPSTPRRTMIIGMIAAIFVPIVTYVSMETDPVFAKQSQRMIVAFDVLWCFATVWVSTFASKVIYGLRTQVAQALQLGQYVLGDKLGEGGMGTVYRAEHVLLKRETAVKLLPPEKAGLAAIARFEREVQHTSRLTHPNTVTIFDYGRTPEGVFFYAMEYLEGIDLQRLVDGLGPQAPERVVYILEQVALALSEAHSLGLVHRDVKPANVILCQRGGVSDVVKVVDFGLVKDVQSGPDGQPALSGVNVIVGTPLYMAPEHIRSADAMDARGDLYALGAVGYFLLAGSPPFPGRSILEVAAGHLHETAPRPSQRLGKPLPADLEDLLLQCLAKEPADRPQDARALIKRLRALDLPRWTDEQAEAWWAEHGMDLDAARKAPRSDSAHTLPVAVA